MVEEVNLLGHLAPETKGSVAGDSRLNHRQLQENSPGSLETAVGPESVKDLRDDDRNAHRGPGRIRNLRPGRLPGDSLREQSPADHRVDQRQNREDTLNVPIHSSSNPEICASTEVR